MDLTIIIVCALLLVAIGAGIGATRGRSGQGALFSFLLGPLGWVIVLCLSDNRYKCSECKGAVPEGARRCLHCGVELVTRVDPKIVPMIYNVDTRVPVDCPACGRTSYVQAHEKATGIICDGCKIGFVPEARKFKLS